MTNRADNVEDMCVTPMNYKPEIFLAATIAASGFGALLLIYLLGDWTVGPGLLYFRSATWGDGLLLPAMASTLLAIARSHTPRPREHVLAGACGFLGGAAGTILQLSWLADPKPRLNWTFPAVGLFNAAGVYHAVFLALCSGLLSATLGLALIRSRGAWSLPAASPHAAETSARWIFVLCCAFSFLALLIADNQSTATTQSSGTSISAAIVGLLMTIILLTVVSGVPVKQIFSSVTLAVTVATGVELLASYRGEFDASRAVLLVVTLGISVAYASANWESTIGSAKLIWFVMSVAASSCILTGLALRAAMKSATPLHLAIFALAGAALLLVFQFAQRFLRSDKFQRRDFENVLSVTLMTVLVVAAARFVDGTPVSQNQGSIIMAAVTIVIFNFVSPTLRRSYDRFVREEEAQTSGNWGSAPVGQRMRGRLVAVYSFGLAVAGLGSLFLITVAVARANGLQLGEPHQTVWPWGVAGATTTGTILLGTLVVPGRARASHITLVAAAGMVWIGSLVWQIRLSGIGWASLAMCVLVGIWTTESVRTNSGLLQRIDISVGSSLATVLVGFAAGTASLWCCTTALTFDGKPTSLYWSLLALGMAIGTSFFLVLMTCVKCFPLAPPVGGTNYGSVSGVLQDQGLMSLLIAILVWLPAFVFVHVPKGTNERWTTVALVCVGFMSLFGTIYCWVVRYNTRHAWFRKHCHLSPQSVWPPRNLEKFPFCPVIARRMPGVLRRLLRSKNNGIQNGEWVEILEAHVTFQNITSLLIVGISIVGIVPFVNELKPNIPDIITN
jgi:hypothetical protein